MAGIRHTWRCVIALVVGSILAIVTPVSVLAVECVGLHPPVPGPVTASFAPVGPYAGHWGVDLGAAPGAPVRSAGSGRVSFSGTVAGNRTITIDHGGGLKTSYSYLEERWVAQGSVVSGGQALGAAGVAHGVGGLHFSVRIHGEYVDPEPRLHCRPLDLSEALRLVEDVG